jgi:amidohydrolase
MINDLRELRRRLHASAEKSWDEEKTAGIIVEYLKRFSPTRVISGIGGHGLAAIYEGATPGPRILIRCELDALPIPETIALDYASQTGGVAHKCGHDGHMTIVSGLAPILHERGIKTGSVVLLYQPAEEIGKGAAAVIADPKFAEIDPDYVFALHNLPGYPEKQIIIREGFFASASKGLIIKLTGATSHAGQPEAGKSPALAVAELITSLSSLVQFSSRLHEAAKVTIIHARIGEVAFGTSPGEGVVMATLRAHDEQVMNGLSQRCVKLAEGIAATYDLGYTVTWDEEFPSTVNDAACANLVKAAAAELGLSIHEPAVPFPWSEDFGHFTARTRGAFFGLGAGKNHPPLHHPTYDFPDHLIASGIRMFEKLINKLTDSPTPE